MAKITRVERIPLESLEVGMGQIRLSEVSKGIAELADSIRKQGQLEPIVVCPGTEEGKYEILIGQRRYVAIKELQQKDILAAIIDERVDLITAKVLSLTENMMRRDVKSKDLIDVCTQLFKHYGSITAVCEETGLPYSKVSLYVKYDQLIPELKKLVDKGKGTGGVDLKSALRAQRSLEINGPANPKQAVLLAIEMSGMSEVQRQKTSEEVAKAPTKDMSDIIEAAKTGAKITQINVTIGENAYQGLRQYAESESVNQDEAALTLIVEGLTEHGFMED